MSLSVKVTLLDLDAREPVTVQAETVFCRELLGNRLRTSLVTETDGKRISFRGAVRNGPSVPLAPSIYGAQPRISQGFVATTEFMYTAGAPGRDFTTQPNLFAAYLDAICGVVGVAIQNDPSFEQFRAQVPPGSSTVGNTGGVYPTRYVKYYSLSPSVVSDTQRFCLSTLAFRIAVSAYFDNPLSEETLARGREIVSQGTRDQAIAFLYEIWPSLLNHEDQPYLHNTLPDAVRVLPTNTDRRFRDRWGLGESRRDNIHFEDLPNQDDLVGPGDEHDEDDEIF